MVAHLIPILGLKGLDRMYFVVFAWIWIAPLHFVQESQVKSGVLVLVDGRMLAIRGELEVFGEEVHFTNAEGQLMALPLAKVDMKATQRKNELLKNGLDDAARRELLDEEPVKKTKRKKPEIWIPDDSGKLKQVEDAVKRPEEKPVQKTPSLEFGNYQEFSQEIKNHLTPQMIWISLVFVGLLAITGLIGFGTQIYLVINSFSVGARWGLSLAFTMLSPLTAPFVALFFPFGLGKNPQFMIAMIYIFPLIFNFLLFLYVLMYKYGSRLKFYTLLYASWPVSIAFMLYLHLAGFPLMEILRKLVDLGLQST